MIGNERIIIGIRTLGRGQTPATFACLYALRFFWDGMVIVGSLDETSQRIVNRMVFDFPIVWDNRKGKVGEQASRLISHLLNWSGEADYVLFLDDDQVFDSFVMEELLKNIEEDVVGLVVVQETLGWGIRDYCSIEVNPSVDFFSLVRRREIESFSFEEIKVLEKLNKGGEFFFINWVVTGKGRNLGRVKVIDLERFRPLHLYFKEKSKIWWNLTKNVWDELYVKVMSCGNLDEVVSVYRDFGLFEK